MTKERDHKKKPKSKKNKCGATSTYSAITIFLLVLALFYILILYPDIVDRFDIGQYFWHLEYIFNNWLKIFILSLFLVISFPPDSPGIM